MKLNQNSEFCGSSLGIAGIGLLLALSGCSYSYPLVQKCESRLSKSLDNDLPKWEYVHTKLLFDFTNADTQKKASILKNGYAGSGSPRTVIAIGNNKVVEGGSAIGSNVITENGKEILVDGPSGAIKDVMSEACALESDGVWLKSVTYSPFHPTDAEIIKIAQ